jgi:ribosomal protein S12 methylthiotransferase
MYVYDNGITDELIDAIASEPKVCNYIDMPIQHISDNVLRLMRRQSTGDSIKAVITKLRERIPDVHVRTTLLVGTPGETEADFDELVDFIDSFDIDRLGAFAFSDEEGTLSHLMDDKVPQEIAEMRRDTVMEHQLAVSEKLNEKKLGKVMEVIVDEAIELDAGNIVEDFDDIDDSIRDQIINTYSGRTRYDAPEIDCAVTFTSNRMDIFPGDVVKVLITDAYEYDLEGKEVTE